MGIAAPRTEQEKRERSIHDGAFHAGVEFAAEVCDKWMNPDYIRLHAGEMTAQEMRSVLAVVKAIAAEIREPGEL